MYLNNEEDGANNEISTVEREYRNLRKKRQTITRSIVECFLGLKESEVAFKDMIPILKISKSALKSLYKKYLLGEFEDMSLFRSAGDKKSVLKDMSFEKNIVASEIAMNPCTTLQSISDKLKTFNSAGKYSLSTVFRIIKKMGYTRKSLTLVPINRNSSLNKHTRAQYATSVNSVSDDMMIFLDETGFNLHSYQSRGYSPKNQKCFINVANSKGTNISVLCAINILGVLAYKIKIGSFKSEDILEFINTQLPLLESDHRKYIIMDNASIHRTSVVREALCQKNYILTFLPPYSPQLNPIEEFFACLKAHVNKRERSTERRLLIESIVVLLDNFEFRMDGYFRHMRVWIDKALAHHDFI
ncbi:Transposable element Tc3 transposase [Dictyocoela muelleri]|nr:Transposable element Tc3 transposase [Dictyocoela muelleri]